MKTKIIRLTACLAAVLAILTVLVLISGNKLRRARAEEDGVKYITGKIDITFDPTRLFLSEKLTGRDIIDGIKYAGLPHFGYNYDGPDEGGWYIDSGGYYTCLVKVDKEYPTYPEYWYSLNYNDEPISKSNNYYFQICIENYDGYEFDSAHLPTITVNGKTPDYVYPVGDPPSYIYVFVPLEYHEDYKLVTEAGPKYDYFTVQRGTSKQLISYVKGNDTSAVWSLVDAESSGTTITPDGLLTVGKDEVNYFEVRCASAVYPEIGRTASIYVTDDPVVVTNIKVTHNAKMGVGYRSQWVNFDAIVSGTEQSDVVWSLQSKFNDPDSHLDEYGSVYIGRGETAKSVTVRATSAFDSTKYGECTLEIKEPGQLKGTIAITYNEKILVLNSAYSGFEITEMLLDPEAGGVSHLSYDRAQDGWYVDSNAYCTHLVKKNEFDEPYYWDSYYYVNDEPLDPDGEYYLRIEVENDIDAGYEWDPANLPKFTVNGKPADIVLPTQYKDGYIDLYVKVKTQKQRSVKLTALNIVDPPIHTIYYPGDTFDIEGIRATAVYSDGNTSDVSGKLTFKPEGALKASDKAVTLSLTVDGVTKTASQAIQVVSKDEYYILTFDSFGGSYVPAQAVKIGDKPVKPADPVKKHLTLAKWIDLSSWDTLDFDKPLSGSIRARALWVCYARADVYPAGSGTVCARGHSTYAEYYEYTPDEYEYSSGGFQVLPNEGYVFKEWRLGGPDGELVVPDETLPYFVLKDYPSEVIFRTTDGGYRFYAIFEPTGEVPGPTTGPEVTAEPGTTAEPSVTAEPGATDDPGTTAEPGASDEPGATAEPGATGEPVTTAEPGASGEPAVTADATPVPATDHGSGSDNSGDNGGKDTSSNGKKGGVPVWVVIVSAVAALGIGAGVTALVLSLKKKKQ
ncbi:MAG: hypothetical protein J6X19_04165 [Clostridia bacterium]|nr:hypothetical protein [Clostridia bacterium]